MVTVTCPNCGDQFQVVIPDELLQNQSGENSTNEAPREQETHPLEAEVVSWETIDDPRDPYSGSDGTRPDIAQQVRADIRINGKSMQFDVWHTPHISNWEYFKYVVRAQTDAGQKSLNVYDSPRGLFVKNRAVPWTTEKQWTYLQPEELVRRSKIAGLGEVIEDEEGEGGYGLLIDMDERPLVDGGKVDEEFLVTLAKTHLVMKSRENPA